VVIEDIVIQNITLTKELETAIEAKMVQEQDAAKAKYIQQRAQIEADTAVIQAKGEAESIRIRGEALKDDPAFVDLKIVDKWDGSTPLVIGGGGLVYQPEELEHLSQLQQSNAPASSSRTNAARR
jgi:prohibitin 2